MNEPKLCECGCGQPTPPATRSRPPAYMRGEPLRFIPGHENRGRKFTDAHRENLKAKSIGREITKETRQKMSDHHKLTGHRPSPEALAKAHRNPPRGEKNGHWRGGVCMLNGYRCVQVPEHPLASSRGYVLEHRLVAERKLGRLLHASEVVHHIDGNRCNNDPANLEVFRSKADHSRFHKQHGVG